MMDDVLVGEKLVCRYSQMDNRLYIDMDWKNDLQVGEYLVDDRVLSKIRALLNEHTDIYNDIYLKRYVTALIKRQWGANLSKFNGVTMIGGVTLNGGEILTEAQQDIEKLETEIRSVYIRDSHMIMG